MRDRVLRNAALALSIFGVALCWAINGKSISGRAVSVQYLQSQTGWGNTWCRSGGSSQSGSIDLFTISGGKVVRSILSPDVRVDDHAHVEECVLMDEVKVGKGARLRRTIVDKRVTIPDGMSIGFDHEQDAKRFLVTEGEITVVPKEMPL